MAVKITATFDQRELKRFRDAIERLSSVGREPRQALGRTGLYMRRDAQRRLRSRPNDWGKQTTRLSQSIAMQLEPASVTIGSNLVYAAI